MINILYYTILYIGCLVFGAYLWYWVVENMVEGGVTKDKLK